MAFWPRKGDFIVYLSLVLNVFLGANPSAEEQEEALEDGATQVNNVVHSFRLQQTSFDKKSFLTYLKVMSSLSDDVCGTDVGTGLYEGSQGQAFSRTSRGVRKGRSSFCEKDRC